QYAIGYGSSPHPLSIRPDLTALALGAGAALALFFLRLARAFTDRDVRQAATRVAILRVALSAIGILQKALWDGKIYRVWTPIQPGDSFGPFVNRNHFAGWMLMALPLTMGRLGGRVARRAAEAAPDWHARALRLASADANETILLAFAAVVMAAAMTLTMS